MLVAQSCPTLCNPINCSPPGSSVHGIHQARILEWVATSVSRRFSQLRDRTWVSCRAGRFFTIRATREAQNERHFRRRRHTNWGLQPVSNQHLFPHLDHSQEISTGEDNDNQGKRASNPLVHRTLLHGSNFMVPQGGHVTRCHSLSFWPEGHCRMPGGSDGRAAQPGHSQSGGFSSKSILQPLRQRNKTVKGDRLWVQQAPRKT